MSGSGVVVIPWVSGPVEGVFSGARDEEAFGCLRAPAGPSAPIALPRRAGYSAGSRADVTLLEAIR